MGRFYERAEPEMDDLYAASDKGNKLHHTFWCFNANSGRYRRTWFWTDFVTWDEEKYEFVKASSVAGNGRFRRLDHEIPLGDNGITLSKAKGL